MSTVLQGRGPKASCNNTEQRQLKFLGHVVETEDLKELLITGRYEEKRARDKQ